MPNNLFKELGAAADDQSDLVALLEARYPRGSSNEGRWEKFEEGQDTPSLILQHNKVGRIVDITPGPALKPKQREELTAYVAKSTAFDETQISSTVLYAPAPAKSGYRVDDALRLVAYTESVPHFFRALFNYCYPVVVEFSFRGDPEESLFSPRKARAERETSLFLAGILPLAIPSRNSRTVWTRPYNQAGPISFSDADVPMRSNELLNHFTDVTDTMPLIPAGEYYGVLFPWVEDTFGVPDDLCTAWDQFQKLMGAERSQFLFACYWTNEARKSAQSSPSAGLVAAVTALEALGNATDLPRCECCNQIRGATGRFRQTLETLAPGSSKVARDLYDFRSTYAHGSGLAGLDHVGHRVTMEQHYDWNRATNAAVFCQYALRRWLDPDVRTALLRRDTDAT